MATDFNNKILVAPLDWGLGHASRCIPLIKHLLELNCTVVLAANGPQKAFFELEFPGIEIEYLAGYNISYSANKIWFPFKIFFQLPKILQTIKKEHQWLNTIVKKHNINAIISDNRYGLWHKAVPVAFITHQLTIKTPFGLAEKIVRIFHYRLINRFIVCWIPDVKEYPNLAANLSHPKKFPSIPVKYIGALSRFEKQNAIEEYDALIVISGPEPQRTILEKKLLKDIKKYKGNLLLVRGLPGETNKLLDLPSATIVNHLPANELALAFAKAKFIISRSGYTTVMDIVKLGKKSILIPTPGQTEQEYLGVHLQKQKWCMVVNQDEFNLQNALQMAAEFPYQQTGINMELYKNVLNDFVASIKKED